MFVVSIAILSLLANSRIVSAQESASAPKASVLETNGIGAFGNYNLKLAPGQAMLYVDAGRGVTVQSTELGIMCAEGSCRFTVPAHRELTLTVVSDGNVKWIGCTSSPDDKRRCALQMTGDRMHVRAFLQKE
jgi:hypothetical protein